MLAKGDWKAYGELEGLHETESLLDGAADGPVVDRDLPEDTLGIDDEEATERDTRILDQHAVVARNLHAAVGDEGDLEVGAKAAGLALELRPCKVRVLRVGGEA